MLGTGGVGVVWEARDVELDRAAAIKVLGPALDGSDLARSRLVREARALAQVQHPNEITIFDASTIDGRDVIAMELIRATAPGDSATRCRRSAPCRCRSRCRPRACPRGRGAPGRRPARRAPARTACGSAGGPRVERGHQRIGHRAGAYHRPPRRSGDAPGNSASTTPHLCATKSPPVSSPFRDPGATADRGA